VLLLAKNGGGQVIALPTPALPTASLAYESTLEIYSIEGQQNLAAGEWLTRHRREVPNRHIRYLDGSRRFDADTIGEHHSNHSRQFRHRAIAQSGAPDMERITGYGYFNFRCSIRCF